MCSQTGCLRDFYFAVSLVVRDLLLDIQYESEAVRQFGRVVTFHFLHWREAG